MRVFEKQRERKREEGTVDKRITIAGCHPERMGCREREGEREAGKMDGHVKGGAPSTRVQCGANM